MRGAWKAVAVICALCVGILVLSLRERRHPIGIRFLGYTNDIFGLYTFGLFDVTNGSKRYLHIRQGATELKISQGWIADTNNLGYHGGNVKAGEHVTVRWVGPGTNCVWRASFEFTDVRVPDWFWKLPVRMQNWCFRWYSKQRTWVIATPEIPPPK